MTRAVRVGLLALVILVWGSTWLAIKVGLEDLPPFLAAATRFLVAATILVGLSRWRGVGIPRSGRIHLALIALGALQFVLSYGAVYWAEMYIPSGLAAVLFAIHPFLVLLLAHAVIPAERITARKAVGVGLGFVGVALIFRSDLALVHPMAPVAAAVILLSPLATAVSGVGIKRWGAELHPFTLTTLPMMYGAIGLGTISFAMEDIGAARWSAGAIGSIAYLAVFGSVVAFVAYYRLLKEVAVSSLALVSYAIPVVALGLGAVLLGERLTPGAWLGAAAIVVGIVLATARRPPRSGTTPATIPGPGPPPSGPIRTPSGSRGSRIDGS